ncbi:type VII secretion protein EssC [Ruminococcus albus]|uniref:DNA segregation ATPase FtsK/SpoIIIE, S-DNA-T family n=1 Tax=Ruminococcus albus TaxID=1264 RepID=A0A1H7LUD7_RUMAL|nr:type VII secretion protein EssC [Ruminococcus albus]SEL02563.1 DNA segregation ATPase FtsK/SpoIIIE, S-DNA-T family [Ruminococcus albus]
MVKQYKVSVRYKNVYREILMNDNSDKVRIGTVGKCHVRFDSSQFFENFFAEITVKDKKYTLSCSENVYISPDGIMKLAVRNLVHGDKMILKYQNSNQEIITIDFLIDFDSDTKKYDREIDISEISMIKIGGTSDCELQINDELIGGSTVSITKTDEHYFVKDNGTEYGVYLNGQRIKNEVQLADFDFISVTSCSLYFKYGKLYTSSLVDVNGLDFKDIGSNSNYPEFVRNTRIKSVRVEDKISILDPPQYPTKPQKSLVASLIPAFAMLALTVVLRGVIGGGGTFVIFSACSMSLGILTSIFNHVGQKKKYKKDVIERKQKYDAYIKRKRNEIETARNEERNILESIYYSVDCENKMLHDFSGDLFDRERNDEDFLCVNIGIGTAESKQPIDYKVQEKLEVVDELVEVPEHIAYEYKYIERVPIVCDFREANGVGVIGSNEMQYEMLKIMVIDLCTRQYQNDLKLFFILNEENSQKMSWLRFIPHVFNEVLDMRNIVSDEKSKNILYEYLYKEMSNREEDRICEPRIVIFIYDDMGIKRHPISRFIENASSLGVTFVFFEKIKSHIPQYCTRLIMLNENEHAGKLILSSDGTKSIDFSYTPVSDKDSEYMAYRLAPVYCEEISLEGTLTKNISLYQLLGITSVEEIDLNERWNKSQVFKSMAAPLGVKKGDEIVYLDLHDKFHGPHGLVAGTTGSGKSEILQTYILSMATLFHPYEVSFVIIDFKGGGMVNQFRTLPHLIGAITNIDGREIDRSLKSIKAELRKRQRLFAEAEVNHIDKYIKKYKSGELKEPLPHLIVIVDEFAELKAEQPDFMKELISAARIGRSLGVHLILATQKPAGQVNEQIWSNSKFKLCLKVQSQSDSNEVLKSPLAAEIKEPGRAYLQVGNNEIFELFQSAYSGSPAKVDESNIKEFKICEVSVSGLKNVVFEQKKPKKDAGEDTQLNAVVDLVYNYCDNKKIKKLPDICLPSLPCSITKNDVEKNDENGFFCEIGVYDDPDNQYQGGITYDLGGQNTMIIGSSQYGKTNLLEWIVKELAIRYTPAELNMYILDFGSMVLKSFESLKHVGGVVCASDDEKLKNLFKLLNEESKKRKDKLVSVGVSSFSSYREAGFTDIPQIIVIIDNLTALKELYLNENDDLLPICRDGISVGISIVAANAQLSGIGYKYLSNFANKIGLYCNDSGEYSSLFGSCRMRPLGTPGRCVVELDKEFYECQTYLAFEGEKEIDRINAMRSFIEEQNKNYPGNGAKIIPVIPKLLDEAFIAQNYEPVNKPYSFVGGLDFSTVAELVLDLTVIGTLCICGRQKSGKGNFIRYMLSQLAENSENAPFEVVIVDDVSRKFSSVENVDKYIIAVDEVKDVIVEWHKRLEERYQMLMNKDPQFEKEPMLILIVQNNDVHDSISKDKAVLALYKEMLNKYKAMKFCVIYSGMENAPIAFGAQETMKMLKEAKRYLVFDDVQNIKVADISMQTARMFKKPIETGDAYYLSGTDVIKIKTVLHQ